MRWVSATARASAPSPRPSPPVGERSRLAFLRAKRLFGDGEPFPTDDGRARFVPTPYRPPASVADKHLPLLLNTGRIRDQWHTMTRTGRLARLMAHQREPLLDVHPDDAARLDLVEGGLARVESAHGETVLPVRLSAAQRRGEVFAAMHWTDAFSSAGPIGRLVQAATDPVSGQPELKLTAVRVTPIAPLWRGLACGAAIICRAAHIIGRACRCRRAMSSTWPAGRRCRAAAAPKAGCSTCSTRHHPRLNW